jgi:hypothetical protein
MANKIFDNAKKQKADEFYTQLSDIEKELKNYKEQFKGKTVFCNCDDPYWSNFFYYFVANFNALGLKKLITTHYIDNDRTLFDDIMPEHPYSLTISKAPKDILTLDRPAMVTRIIAENGGRIPLKGDGDFRSAECIALLKEADIVVTNPPFSLFREYVTQLIEYEKQFLIIGNKNCITYKEVFKYIKENRIWLGYRNINSDIWFQLPDDSKNWEKEENGKKLKHISACWFTNLDHKRHHEDLILTEHYDSIKYPAYDNYKAINVDKVSDIPMDYKGVMGVPITFVDKYNPDQFEIIGLANDKRELDDAFVQGNEIYLDDQHKKFVGMVLNENNKLRATYARILIRNRSPVKNGGI